MVAAAKERAAEAKLREASAKEEAQRELDHAKEVAGAAEAMEQAARDDALAVEAQRVQLNWRAGELTQREQELRCEVNRGYIGGNLAMQGQSHTHVASHRPRNDGQCHAMVKDRVTYQRRRCENDSQGGSAYCWQPTHQALGR